MWLWCRPVALLLRGFWRPATRVPIASITPLLLSLLWLLMLQGLMWLGGVEAPIGSMARFAWRGAILGFPLSLVFDKFALGAAKLFTVDAVSARFVASSIAGGLQEVAKLIALPEVVKLFFSQSHERSSLSSWPASWKSRMLAGVSAGVGFMVVDITLRIGSAVLSLPHALPLKTAKTAVLLAKQQGISDLDILLNPCLTGIAAVRFSERLQTRTGLAHGVTLRQVGCALWSSLWPLIAFQHVRSNILDAVRFEWRLVVWIVGALVFRLTWSKPQENKGPDLYGMPVPELDMYSRRLNPQDVHYQPDMQEYREWLECELQNMNGTQTAKSSSSPDATGPQVRKDQDPDLYDEMQYVVSELRLYDHANDYRNFPNHPR